MLVIINALKSISRSKGRNILIGLIVLTIAASSCVALAISNAAGEAEVSAAAQAETDEKEARQKAEQDLADKQTELESTKEGLKSNLSITGSISLDRRKMMETIQNSGTVDRDAMRELQSQFQELSLSELQSHAESQYVKDFFYTASISLNATGTLEAYGSEDNTNQSSANSQPGMISGEGRPGGQGGQDGGMRQGFILGGMSMGDFNLTGYTVEESMMKFKNGTATITGGAMIDVSSADMNCLISNEVAVFNSLAVGDKITLSNPGKDDETYTFTVAGIYTDTGSAETGDAPMFATAQDPANLICISYPALQKIEENSSSVATTGKNAMGMETTTALSGQISHTFVFSGLEDYEKFSAELTEKGLENYTLTSSDLSDYNRQISEIESTMTGLEETINSFDYTERLIPIQNLSKFAATMFWVILAIGALILIVINVFNIRERKYEVGVLTAIGIKKGKVALQFVTELLCVTMIAIVLGSGVGAAASVPVADYLLSDRVEQIQAADEEKKAAEQEAAEQEQNDRFPGGMPGNIQGGQRLPGTQPENNTDILSAYQKDTNYLNKINATFNFAILMQLIGIGILLTVISSLAAVVFVMRYEPLKILANRT